MTWILRLIAHLTIAEQWQELRANLLLAYKPTLSEKKKPISPHLLQFLILGEDHRYFSHSGVDYLAICRAIWRRIFWGVREGASTIEMQTVRVLTGHYECTIQRKAREILLATLLSEEIPKHDLLKIYLYIAYYGWRMNGIRQACNRLGFLPHIITIEDAARLIARLKYPEAKIPPLHRIRQIERRTRHLLELSRHYSQRLGYKPVNEVILCDRSSYPSMLND